MGCGFFFSMRFTLLSQGGDGVGLAIRLRAEGHQVKLWIRESETEDRGKGLIDRADSVEQGEIIIADCTGAGAICDNLRSHGALVFGGSCLADRLEADRDFAQQVMERCGIATPEAQSFNDWDAAIEFIKKSDKRLVFKPEGSLSGNIPSYCAKDNEELLSSIDHFKILAGPNKPEFTLQEFIEGTAVSTEAWFDGNKFIEPFNHTIETKHFLNGNLGPSGGCTGNLVWLADRSDPVVRETVLRMEGFLREHAYIGAIDVNAVVSEQGVYALEFTPRFGYDAFPTYLQTIYTGEFGWLIYQMARGEATTQDVTDRFGAGVRVTIPPWPNERHKPEAERGVAILGLDPRDLATNFYPYDVELRDGQLYSSGGYGVLGVVNESGDSCGEAFTRAYDRVEQLQVVDLQYRTDLGEVIRNDYRELERLTGRRDDMGWIGTDLDKTLAEGSTKEIGEPIPAMVTRIKRWFGSGKEVRIVTARAAKVSERLKVYDWQKEHLGMSLEVTDQKDHQMKTLWDDRTVAVEKNTGERA